jgi:hypothetical protein
MERPFPWLKYIAGSDPRDPSPVQGPNDEELGTVDGFIVDEQSRRPYYVVVDAGGWFSTKHFLVPIGHAHLAQDGRTIRTDLTKTRVRRFPGFDKDAFDTLTSRDLTNLRDTIDRALRDEGGSRSVHSASWDTPSYRTPEWWDGFPTRPRPS